MTIDITQKNQKSTSLFLNNRSHPSFPHSVRVIQGYSFEGLKKKDAFTTKYWLTLEKAIVIAGRYYWPVGIIEWRNKLRALGHVFKIRVIVIVRSQKDQRLRTMLHECLTDLKREGGLLKGWRIKKYHICVIIVRVNKVSFYKIFSWYIWYIYTTKWPLIIY